MPAKVQPPKRKTAAQRRQAAARNDRMKAVEDDVAILKRAMQGGWADDGVTWQDGLAQTMQSLTESVVALKNDRKALFALLGMTTIATSATAIHGTGIWQTILQFFGGH